ncbi:IclR family transcriptional regulator [Rhodococcus pyridinivorans]|uniref:IclR family transcriptional regulator n=1 Tax=Rhodococcus pyridinivorans TaxID=103816 RepID=UPI001E2B4EDF|nr:IclR family transcriptional regulator [Rhodococcus pyridinivorans]MCD5422462.1 IclR family transcriptional regulator [Rhodococcus pyridinivorans]
MAEVSKTTDQALEVLEFLGQRGTSSIAEAARELSLSRTVVYRLFSTLEQRGFVKRHDGIYRLGPKLFALAQHVEWAVRDAADPHMRELVNTLKETVVLSVRDGSQTLTVHRIASREQWVQVIYPPGVRKALTDTVGGRVILANLESREQIDILGIEENRMTPELGRIRRAGFAASRNEELPGLAGFAVPIRSVDGVAASLTVYSPSERAADTKAHKDLIVRAGDAISAELLNESNDDRTGSDD